MNDQFVYESVRIADSDDNSSDDEDMDRIEQNIQVWLDYCRATESRVRDYLQRCRVRIRRFPNSTNGHIFMLEVLQDDPQIAFQEFRMYPPLFVNFTLVNFTHLLRDEFGLSSRLNVDIYEQVGMFLCILAHGKGYRKIRNRFGHSMDTIHHYFGIVLRAVVALGARIIRPKPNYNESPPGHRPCPNKHPHFQDCIGAIDGTHVKAVLSTDERVHFIGRKGYPTQNVLAACDFDLCFTFVLPRTTGNVHDSRILARAIHNPDINFPVPANGKYYLVDSGFAHRTGYMAPYKGANIRYHFQEFHSDASQGRRRFRDTREHFNFKHSSLRNVIERAFGVLKSRWTILDRMPRYPFRKQTAVVVAAITVHNFIRRAGQHDNIGSTTIEDEEAAEIDLPDEIEQMAADYIAPQISNTEWDQYRDFLARKLLCVSAIVLHFIL